MNMNKITRYYIGLTAILIAMVILMAGCGTSSPTGAGRFVSGNTNPAMLTVTVNFPTRPAAYMAPQPLISASTLLMDIGVYSVGSNILVASGAISAPPTGGTASTTLKVYQYEGPVYIDIMGYNTTTVTPPMLGYIGGAAHNQPMTGAIQKTGLNITFGTTTPVSMAFVEGDQGVANITGMNMISPDGTTYVVNDLFLLYTGTFGQSYQLAARVTNLTTGSSSYIYSGQSHASMFPGAGTASINMITDSVATFPLSIPSADGKAYNNYSFNLNFAPAGVPVNTPTITEAFLGTSAANVVSGANNLSVAWSGTKYLVSGCGGILLTSPDLITWTSQNAAGTVSNINAVASGPGKFVAVTDAVTVLSSVDGITWTSAATPYTYPLYDVTWTGASYMTVGGWGGIYTSPDAITWTTSSFGMTSYYLLSAASGSKYVAVGQWGTVMTSSDSVTWALSNASTTNHLNKIRWTGSQYLIAGDVGTIITSSDAVTWAAKTSGTANNLLSIASGSNKFVAVGAMGTILTSADTITWTPSISGVTTNLHDVIWTGTQYVAVGDYGAVLTSPDAITWTIKNTWSQGSGFVLPNASWSNYVAPPPPVIQTVVF